MFYYNNQLGLCLVAGLTNADFSSALGMCVTYSNYFTSQPRFVPLMFSGLAFE